MSVFWKLILSLILVFVFGGQPAWSCCAGITPQESFDLYTSVFIGKVIGMENISDMEVDVTLRVYTAWKGIDSFSVIIRTVPALSFAYRFIEGQEYLVYARDSQTYPILNTNLCSGTKELSAAEEDLEFLGPATWPVAKVRTWDSLKVLFRGNAVP